MLKLVRSSTSGTNLVANIDFKAAFSHICISITSTAKAVAGVQTQADLGILRYIKRNETKINSTMSMLKYWSDFKGGNNRFFTSATASFVGCRYWLIIPRGLGDGNVDYVTPEDGARVEIDFGPNFATNFISPNTNVYLYQATGLHKYDLTLQRIVENLSAGQQKNITLNTDNLSEVWISDAQNPGTANGTLNENMAVGAAAAAVSSGLMGVAGAAATAATHGSFVFQIGDVTSQGTFKEAVDWTNSAFSVETAPNVADTDYVGTIGTGTCNVTMANIYTDVFGAIHESLQSSAQLIVTNGTTQAAQAAVFAVGKRFTKTNKAASELELSYKLKQTKDFKLRSGETSGVRTLEEAGVLS